MPPSLRPRALLLLAVALTACREGDPDRGARGEERGAGAAAGDPFAGLPPLACATRDPAPSVTAQGVGIVRVGSPAADIAAQCPSTDTTLTPGEGPGERVLLVSLGGSVVTVIATGDTVRRVVVTTPGVRTGAGVAVGSTVGEVRRAHGRVCGAIGEGAVVVYAPRLPGVAFATSADYALVASRAAELTPRAAPVPDSARVTQLWAYGAERAAPCA